MEPGNGKMRKKFIRIFKEMEGGCPLSGTAEHHGKKLGQELGKNRYPFSS